MRLRRARRFVLAYTAVCVLIVFLWALGWYNQAGAEILVGGVTCVAGLGVLTWAMLARRQGEATQARNYLNSAIASLLVGGLFILIGLWRGDAFQRTDLKAADPGIKWVPVKE